MKKRLFHILFLLSTVVLMSGSRSANPISPDGTYKGRKLYGRVRLVPGAADFDVSISDCNGDLRVELTEGGCFRPGQWNIVEHGADFTVHLSTSGKDFTIEFSNFPGVRN